MMLLLTLVLTVNTSQQRAHLAASQHIDSDEVDLMIKTTTILYKAEPGNINFATYGKGPLLHTLLVKYYSKKVLNPKQ